MGMFKHMKSALGVVNEMPAVMAQAQQLQQQALLSRANGNLYGQPAPAPPIDEQDARLAPIAGVGLARYAQVSKTGATRGLDRDALAAYVRSLDITDQDWQTATEGWQARFKGDMHLAVEYGRLYQEAAV